MDENEEFCEASSPEEQEARSQLRERFLRLVSHLSGGHKCKMVLFDNIEYTCNVKAFNSATDNVVIENLSSTQNSLIPQKVILRTSDIISMAFEVENLNSFKH